MRKWQARTSIKRDVYNICENGRHSVTAEERKRYRVERERDICKSDKEETCEETTMRPMSKSKRVSYA